MQTNNDKTIPPFLFLRPHPIQRDCCGDYNGYISLPLGHCWYGKHYDKINEWGFSEGGLTYSEEEDGRWVIGFDTGRIGGHLLDKEKVTEKAERLLENAADAERWEREQERERQAELECHERREEGRHWYQPYPDAVPLDLWELFRAITYEIHGKITHDLLMETVSHHSTRSNKLDAYRIYYPENGWIQHGDDDCHSLWISKPILGIRYGMGVGDYDSPLITPETAALFNLDPLNRDN